MEKLKNKDYINNKNFKKDMGRIVVTLVGVLLLMSLVLATTDIDEILTTDTTVNTTTYNTTTDINVIPGKITQQIGDTIVDLSISPYMRGNTIAYTGRGYKPNTTLRAWFDGVEVTKRAVKELVRLIKYDRTKRKKEQIRYN